MTLPEINNLLNDSQIVTKLIKLGYPDANSMQTYLASKYNTEQWRTVDAITDIMNTPDVAIPQQGPQVATQQLYQGAAQQAAQVNSAMTNIHNIATDRQNPLNHSLYSPEVSMVDFGEALGKGVLMTITTPSIWILLVVMILFHVIDGALETIPFWGNVIQIVVTLVFIIWAISTFSSCVKKAYAEILQRKYGVQVLAPQDNN